MRINVDINSLTYEKAYELFYLIPAGDKFEKELLERMDYLTPRTPKTDENLVIAIMAKFRDKKNDH
jgi:hypothetical protein